MAADDKLAEELTQAIAEHLAEWGTEPYGDLRLNADRAAAKAVTLTLEWLAERGRLTPDGASVEEQWAAEVMFADGDIERWHERLKENAELLVATNPAKRRLVHRTVITGPWEPAPEETPMASAEAHVTVSLDKPVAEYVEKVREALRGDVEALRAAGWVPLGEVLDALRDEAEQQHATASSQPFDVANHAYARGFAYASYFLAERFGREAT